MIKRNRMTAAAAVVLIGLIVAAAALILRQTVFHPTTISAYFIKVTGIYPGDDVRVSGLKVGTIKAIEPQGTRAKMTLVVDHGVSIPADAKAVIVAQNLVAARYVQLTPAYRSSGATMADGAVIPIERTAVPVEWDQIKDQLTRLATDLGPNSNVSTPSVARFIDSAASALGGNGDRLRQTIAELSGVGRILADGSGNLADTIKNLQTFVTALRDSGQQLVLFNNRFATLTSVLDESKSNLDAALTELSTATVEVQRFIAGSRDQTSEQIHRLGEVTQVLADNHMAVENVLHVAPNALANAYNDYDPDYGGIRGGFSISNSANPVWAYCSLMEAIGNVTASESGKLCGLFLSPGLRVANPMFLLNFNYVPIPINPFLAPAADPRNIIYSEPRLAPGGEGPKPGPAELPPAVSAYTGLPGDIPPGSPPPPPGRIPGAAMPEPPAPTTPAEPPSPIPGLLPAEGTQP
jgi:virulence factor Mce-like protein